MTSQVLHRHRHASAGTRTFALAVAGALTASMLVASPALGNGAIERLGSVELLVSDGEPNSGLAVSDATHAYFAFVQENASPQTGSIVKVDAVTLQRVGATDPIDLPSGWSSLVMDSDHLYAVKNGFPAATVLKIDKTTMQPVGTALELLAANLPGTENVSSVRVAHVAGGFGYFGGKASNKLGIVKVDLSDMTVAAYREIDIPLDILLTGVFDTGDGYVIYAATGDSSTYRRVLRFALADITTTSELTPASGDLVEIASPGPLPTGDTVQSVVMDATHLFLGTAGGHVIKFGKTFPVPGSPVPSTALPGTPNLQSAVLAGTHAYFSGDGLTRVAKVDLSDLTRESTELCPREFVGSTVLAPNGDLLVATRSGGLADHVTRIVRVGAGSRAACPGGSTTTGSSGGGGGDDPAVDVPVAAAVAAASAAGVAGSSSAVLVRGGEVVPVTSSSAAGAGPRGGVVLEAEGLKVTVAAAGGASPQTGVVAPVGGEIVCELCAAFAAGSTIEAWVYSSPQLTAAAQVPDDHEDGDCILLRIPMGAPLEGEPVAAGAHTLQLRMDVQDGLEVLATGVTVGTAVPSGIPAGDGPVDRGLLGMFGLLAVAGAVAVRRLVVTG